MTSNGPMRKLLVANRAEIAVRILHTARELGLETYAIYSQDDNAHASAAHHALGLPSPAAYTDINVIRNICQQHHIDHVHPGYGFMSESPEFAKTLSDSGITVIGPGWEVLYKTGDKLKSKALAEECGVPVLPSMFWQEPGDEEWNSFIQMSGYPILFKLADGGGGRGIHLVHGPSDLKATLARIKREGGRFLVEKAAMEGFHHVEVQIIGDGRGGVRHLWERDCSIQRRFQKVVEVAPSHFQRGRLLAEVIDCAVRMAAHVKYCSLGTFEFLVREQTSEFFFLEINPRIQVEHTISESIACLDLVQVQLQIAQGIPLSEISGPLPDSPSQPPPRLHSIQLRLCAEDAESSFGLSVGKIKNVRFPTGNGVRVDSHLHGRLPAVVSSDFDNLLAKIIVTASTWEACLAKAKRSLEDMHVEGVKTNLDLFRGIVAHPDTVAGATDTQWLQGKLPELLKLGKEVSRRIAVEFDLDLNLPTVSSSSASSKDTVLLRPADAWSLAVTPQGDRGPSQATALHHVRVDKLSVNQFPEALNALLTYTASGADAQQFRLELRSTRRTAGETTGSGLRKGDGGNAGHVVTPLAGKLVELMVELDDVVCAGDVVAYVRQMKMEIEVRVARAGRVVWLLDFDDEGNPHGLEVAEGTLIAEIHGQEDDGRTAKL